MTKSRMQKPSPQFVSKLENELRMAYRAQFRQQNDARASRGGFGNLLKFFVPAFSGALILAVVVLNGTDGLVGDGGKNVSQQNSQVRDETADDQFMAFTAGKEEEEIMADFENAELDQIDNEVRLIAEANF